MSFSEMVSIFIPQLPALPAKEAVFIPLIGECRKKNCGNTCFCKGVAGKTKAVATRPALFPDKKRLPIFYELAR